MANEKNLKPIRSTKEARERGANGGKASGKARKRKRILQEAAQLILNAKITGDGLKELEEIGFYLPEATWGLFLIGRIFKQALDGNTQAAKIILELAGEGESFNLRREELEIKRATIKAMEKGEREGSNGLLQLAETLRLAHEQRAEMEA